MVIDDDADILILYKTILEMNNYDVILASSGSDALEVLSKIELPDLMLVDVIMREMSGPEFLLKLEEMRPDIFKRVPIVFSSALEKVPESKAIGFIRKPRDVGEFLGEVRRFVDKKREG